VALDRWAAAMAPGLAREGVRLVSVCPGFVRTAMTARNPYPMPGLMDAERAAGIILRGLERGRGRVVFPWWMGTLARLGGMLPPGLLARLPGKPALPPSP
jgi:short-subunit dehydrogenase